jgi:hypothetical protein
MFKIAGTITSTIITVFLLVWFLAGPGADTFYPLIQDLFIRIGSTIQFPSSS